ncbi:MAG: hypothetical protein NUW37_19170 [Planctomycetes bacterium]|nr:hypothetical protein [Planctomycetota bacterium]
MTRQESRSELRIIVLIALIISILGVGAAAEDDGVGTWRRLSSNDAPASRGAQAIVWSGDSLIVWGGMSRHRRRGPNGTDALGDGAIYLPQRDHWNRMSTKFAPSPRYLSSKVWTGLEMIVWGGMIKPGHVAELKADGARYNLSRNEWTTMSAENAPSPRSAFASTWTGSKMIVWGGMGADGKSLGDGKLYDPKTDTWENMSSENAPEARIACSFGFWSGSKFIVFGGSTSEGENSGLATGGIYDPETDSWQSMAEEGALRGSIAQSGACSESALLCFSAAREEAEGGRALVCSARLYNFEQNKWTEIKTCDVIPPRLYAGTLWTGKSFIVYGGLENESGAGLKDGAIYDPEKDEWRKIEVHPERKGTALDCAVWTGSKMLVFAGCGPGRRDPHNELWEFDPDGD